MNIAIIDADLIANIKSHRFPNLASMKISGYCKGLGYNVELKLDYNNLEIYDKVFISKVFTETQVDEDVLNMSNVKYGGTGFFYDLATPLLYEIEHHMPDYHLYDEWVNSRLANGDTHKSMEQYIDFSIGMTTRGCMRQCSFCVNKNSKQSIKHSPIEEFLDVSRKYICLLDDNIFACSDWKSIFDSLIATNKRFQYKQGMDERLLTKEKCDYLFNKSKWYGDYLFAFDKISERDIIVEKLEMIRSFTSKKNIKFYVFTGYNHDNIGDYTEDFYIQDIKDLLERISILSGYGCKPYVMRFIDSYNAPYPFKNLYITIAGWTNQPTFYKSMTLREFSIARGMKREIYKEFMNNPETYEHKKGISWETYDKLIEICPEVEKYYNFKGDTFNKFE